jgi:hypothetical protein
VLGINKLLPRNGGHCVAEVYINEKWIVIDPSYFQLNLIPSRSSFYKENHIAKKGLDSWDCGVKTVKDWDKISKELVNKIKYNSLLKNTFCLNWFNSSRSFAKV